MSVMLDVSRQILGERHRRCIYAVFGWTIQERAQRSLLPVRGVSKLCESEKRLGFAGLGEELLHQPLFVLMQGFELPTLRRDQAVQRAEAVRDLLLLLDVGQRQLQLCDVTIVNSNTYSTIAGFAYERIPLPRTAKTIEVFWKERRRNSSLKEAEYDVVRTHENIAFALPSRDRANVQAHGVVGEPIVADELVPGDVRSDQSFRHRNDAILFLDPPSLFPKKACYHFLQWILPLSLEVERDATADP